MPKGFVFPCLGRGKQVFGSVCLSNIRYLMFETFFSKLKYDAFSVLFCLFFMPFGVLGQC